MEVLEARIQERDTTARTVSRRLLLALEEECSF